MVEKLPADPVAWVPGLSIVATTEDGKVVGHVLLSRATSTRLRHSPAPLALPLDDAAVPSGIIH